jgi:hypothetical protein
MSERLRIDLEDVPGVMRLAAGLTNLVIRDHPLRRRQLGLADH